MFIILLKFYFYYFQPFIEIREARHPCVVRTFGGGDFIPNDTVIGIADVSLL
jgi:DNA mismatch repair ATPase MutS